ncbi:(Fe-S)-binding protein [Desulfovibrio sulfodismutans]|uniref:Glycolate oxidase iron-sulfur subunit n=1 Tax=Desulfolutivibrio sulfodismutans TaxID=63561 RepID=A0A7K3NQ26_9BACT|nr:(Fe-S)-binding protein [Desulfolutivibrio sulfodismutans]NDY58312.1 (Fe-S)-binding protein [Desulfolutivibrio sulfodismutans]QLA13761.1 4Fe-4S dicluster domain-containing protein [Desulfolutivibrio sulfodismutans DSM 3696]
MGDVKELLRLLSEIDDSLVSCMRCGMCQAVCPVYAETGLEAHVARGKIALLEGLSHEALKDPQAVMDRLDMCLLCGSCAAGCPSGVKVLDIFLKAKAFLAGYLGLPPAQKAILRGLLAHRKVFDSVMTVASKLQGLVTKPANEVIGSSCAVFGASLLGGRHFMPLADTAFHKTMAAKSLPAKNGQPTVAFFYGCMVDRMYPRIGQAVMKVLAHHGAGAFVPDAQVCCGIPALSAGDLQTFEKLVKENIAVFADQPFDVLITPCATCTSTIKKIWPEMCDGLPGATRAAVKELAAKTMDVNEFLVKNLGVAASATPSRDARTKVTVHDPCHLKKSLGVFAEPRAVIAANPGMEIVEMAAPDACCGCGGSFTLKHYDIAGRIGKRKRDDVVSTNASVVAAGCPACLLQISDMLSKSGDAVAVMHPVEIYAQTLDEARPGTGGNTP